MIALSFWTGVFIGAVLATHLLAQMRPSNRWTDYRVGKEAVFAN